jgi:hypothetical protein
MLIRFILDGVTTFATRKTLALDQVDTFIKIRQEELKKAIEAKRAESRLLRAFEFMLDEPGAEELMDEYRVPSSPRVEHRISAKVIPVFTEELNFVPA